MQKVPFIINLKKKMVIKLLKDFKIKKRKNIWKLKMNLIKIKIIILSTTVLMKSRINFNIDLLKII